MPRLRLFYHGDSRLKRQETLAKLAYSRGWSCLQYRNDWEAKEFIIERSKLYNHAAGLNTYQIVAVMSDESAVEAKLRFEDINFLDPADRM